MTNAGLYIHIPFCNTKCHYCDFASFVCNNDLKNRYVDCLCTEMQRKGELFKGYIFDTIYIGGGTPSVLPYGCIKKIVECIQENFDISKNTEFTIEVNPNSLTDTKLKEYISCGVNRVSMGVQSINDNSLHAIGRKQSFEDVKNAFEILHRNGINNISADMMLGLPFQTRKDIRKIVNFFVKHKVKHISAYMLQLEDNTKLKQNVQSGKIVLPSDEETTKLYQYAIKLCNSKHYCLYEISNLSKKHFESKHNIKYWNDIEYLGLGVSSSSYYGGMRYTNNGNLEEYLNNIESNSSVVSFEEKLDKDTMRTEKIMLSLRTAKGLDLIDFETKFEENLLESKKNIIKKYKKALNIKNGRLYIKPKYFVVSNQIILDLI